METSPLEVHKPPFTISTDPSRIDVELVTEFLSKRSYWAPGMPREVLEILRGLAGLNVIGGDVVEVAPQYDATTNTAQAGAQMLFEILCLAATARNAKRIT